MKKCTLCDNVIIDKLHNSKRDDEAAIISNSKRKNNIELHKCDLSPDSVGDPATGALPSSLKAPTNLLQEEKSWLPWYPGEL